MITANYIPDRNKWLFSLEFMHNGKLWAVHEYVAAQSVSMEDGRAVCPDDVAKKLNKIAQEHDR
jgi:hypothetical protein